MNLTKSKVSPDAIMQRNGQVVAEVLSQRPKATLEQLVDELATEFDDVDSKTMKNQVKDVLNNGVKFGFIHKKGQMYSLKQLDDDMDADPEPMDKRKRSRSRRRSRSRKSRSRSRSRRRRRR